MQHAAFELEQPARLALRVTGSFERPRQAAAALAAYGWIVRRDDRTLAWMMNPAAAEPGRGTAAHVRDTVLFAPGRYDVYFTSYGGGASGHEGRDARWRNDHDQWQLVLRTADGTAGARALEDPGLEAITQGAPGLVWTSAPMRSDRQEAFLFEVRRPTPVQLYAVGELAERPADYGWIESAETGERLWEMTPENTEPAGGLARNRSFRGSLELPAGVYRAVFVTDGEHAVDDWRGHPPVDPAGWGLSLSAASAEDVVAFDPWAARRPLVSIMQVPDDASYSHRFEVRQPVQVVLYGLGEISHGELYDYAELSKEGAGTVWKMSEEASTPAGGSDKNRMEVAFLKLEPGTYTLSYVTDNSHAYGDWNAEEPAHPERWGVTLFPLAATLEAGAVRVLSSSQGSSVPPVPPPTPGGPSPDAEALVAWSRLGREANERAEFTLEAPSRLHVVALGEITASGQHDYGRIERAGTGEVVWEMTLANTQQAGGAERNRRFDGVVELPAGTYVVSYRTDFSHHFGDFRDEAPDSPEAWGMAVYRVEE
jgi:hypothetical protein